VTVPRGSATVLTVRVERDDLDGGFVVSADEAPGCMSQGDTITAALENFADAFTDWAIARALRGMVVSP
jgi:predicted RNase H-like HicB family nuclease